MEEQVKKYNLVTKIWRIIYLPLIYIALPFLFILVGMIIYAIYIANKGIDADSMRRNSRKFHK